MRPSSNTTFVRQLGSERTLSRRQLLKLLGVSTVGGLILGACASESGFDVGTSEFTIPIGSYTDAQVTAPCGLAGRGVIIGTADDPDSFKIAQRVDAQILWFTQGHVEYAVPSVFAQDVVLESLELSMELCSEVNLHNDVYPSDITLWLNGTTIGTWTSPGDFGDRPGLYTPDAWWDSRFTQYGQLKTFRIDAQGSYLDGVRVSEATLDDLKLLDQDTFSLRLGIAEDAQNVGGLNLFGEKFGDYGQSIVVKFQARSG